MRVQQLLGIDEVEEGLVETAFQVDDNLLLRWAVLRLLLGK